MKNNIKPVYSTSTEQARAARTGKQGMTAVHLAALRAEWRLAEQGESK